MLDHFLEPDYERYPTVQEQDLQNKMYKVGEFFTSIMNQSFGKEKFNCELFEHCLDEIAHILEIKPLTGPLGIGEKNA